MAPCVTNCTDIKTQSIGKWGPYNVDSLVTINPAELFQTKVGITERRTCVSVPASPLPQTQGYFVRA